MSPIVLSCKEQMRGNSLRSNVVGIDWSLAQATAWALQNSLHTKASPVRPLGPLTMRTPQHPPPSFQPCHCPRAQNFVLFTLEPFQRYLREPLVKNYSYPLHFHSLTRKEQQPEQLRTLCCFDTMMLQPFQLHTSCIMNPYWCFWLFNNRLASENCFYLQFIISNFVTRKYSEEVVKRPTRWKLFSGGPRLQAVMHAEVISGNNALGCNQFSCHIRTIAIKLLKHQRRHCRTSLGCAYPKTGCQTWC